jgi:hypothetical protein
MDSLTLRDVLARCPARQPLTDTALGQGYRESKSSERDHVLNWLAEYQSPGYYGRQGLDRTARQFYQGFQDAFGLLWVAEALGVEEAVLSRGVAAIQATPGRPGSRAAAFRQVCPWALVEARVQLALEAHSRADMGQQGGRAGTNSGKRAEAFLEGLVEATK